MFDYPPTSETEWLPKDAAVFNHGDLLSSHRRVARCHGTSGPSGSRAETYFAATVEEPFGGEAPSELVGGDMDSGLSASPLKDLSDAVAVEGVAALATPQRVVPTDVCMQDPVGECTTGAGV